MADGRACAPLEDFPLLTAHAAGGPPLAYLDNAATTQKPSCVLDAMDDFYRTACGNPHRSAHALAAAATRASVSYTHLDVYKRQRLGSVR